MEQQTTQNKGIQVLLTVLKWLGAIFFTYLLISSLYLGDIIPAILFLTGLLILLPPLGKFWRSKVSFLSNRPLKAGILILFVVGGIGLMLSKERKMTFGDKKGKLDDYIKENVNNPSIQNIRQLGEISGLFGKPNNALEKPRDGYIVESDETGEGGRKLLVFNPQWGFGHSEPFLKDDEKNGILTDYVMKFDLDDKGKVVSERTVISYSKAGVVEYAANEVPDYTTFIVQETVDNKRVLIEAQKQKEKAEKEATDRLKKFEENCLSGWDGSCTNVVNAVKNRMNDPESFEHNETRYRLIEDYALVTMSFRGNNAFGTKILNTVKAKVRVSDCAVLSIE